MGVSLIKNLFILTIFFIISAFSQANWNISYISYKKCGFFNKNIKIRAGYLKANKDKEFKGNILYLQGLGDSMLNHDRLLKTMSNKGYRVISFDYMGQGGSQGTMNSSRIISPMCQKNEISTLAKFIYKKLKRKDSRKPILIGWSTGGLVSYQLASLGWPRKIILFAPGLHLSLMPGKYGKITIDTLTSDRYDKNNRDPHIDPISPDHILKVPSFAINMLNHSATIRKKEISKDIEGLVFITDKNDPYVQKKENLIGTLSNNAPHFHQVILEDSRHEVDNENSDIRKIVIDEINYFLL